MIQGPVILTMMTTLKIATSNETAHFFNGTCNKIHELRKRNYESAQLYGADAAGKLIARLPKSCKIPYYNFNESQFMRDVMQSLPK